MNDERLIPRLRIESFKSIARTELELGQLTVVVGENSAGKSSLMQSITLLSQIARTDAVGAVVPLHGDDTDLGSFKNALHSGQAADEITIALTINDRPPTVAGATRSEALQVPDTHQWTLTLADCPDRPGHALLRRIIVEASAMNEQLSLSSLDPQSGDSGEQQRARDLISLLRRSVLVSRAGRDASLESAARSALGDINAPLFEGRYRWLSDPDDPETQAVEYVEVSGGLPDELFEADGNLNHLARVFLTMADVNGLLGHRRGRSARTVRARGEIAISIEADDGIAIDDRLEASFTKWLSKVDESLRDPASLSVPPVSFKLTEDQVGDIGFVPLAAALADASFSGYSERDQLFPFHEPIVESSDIIRDSLGRRLHLLGPLRSEPAPMFRPGLVGDGITPLGKQGQFTVAFLDQHGAELVSCPLSPDDSESGDSTELPLTQAVDYWLQRLGIADRTRMQHVGRMIEFDLVDPQTNARRDLTTVGVGASQVLPVLVLCLAAKPGDLILLEQPELHLHPKPQQVLGDFLLGIANTGRQLMVETHSEYLVTRLRRRMVEQRLDEQPNAMKLLYATRERGATTFTELKPNSLGAFDAWPEGFFDQSPRESEQIIRAAAARRRAERNEVSQETSEQL